MINRIFLDTTFFFPLIQVEVGVVSKQDLLDLIKNDQFQIIRSDLVLFELSANGSKLVNKRKITVNDLTEGINALYYSQKIQSIPLHYSEIQMLATELRKIHSDFIDCIILSSAFLYSDMLITQDKKIMKLIQNEWNYLVEDGSFQVMYWKDFNNRLHDNSNL